MLVGQQSAHARPYCPTQANANPRYPNNTIPTACSSDVTDKNAIPSNPLYSRAADDSTDATMAPRQTLPSEQKHFTCPKCNSGHGRYINAYTTPSQKRKLAQISSSHEEPSSAAPPRVEIRAQYVTKKAFKKHIKACHIHDFKKPLTDVYECCYCPCDGLGNFVRCSVEYSSEEDLINHLADCHAKGQKNFVKEKHVC